MDWKDRIVATPETLFGKPRILGTRISVELILDRLADGWTQKDILASYPNVTNEDIRATLTFVAEIYREEHFVAKDKSGV